MIMLLEIDIYVHKSRMDNVTKYILCVRVCMCSFLYREVGITSIGLMFAYIYTWNNCSFGGNNDIWTYLIVGVNQQP
jgi:hypothetical protein